jgi:hypothetical protein
MLKDAHNLSSGQKLIYALIFLSIRPSCRRSQMDCPLTLIRPLKCNHDFALTMEAFLSDPSEVLIGLTDGDHFSLSNWRSAHEGWLSADAEVLCGVWNAKIKVEFRSHELVTFAKELRNLYRDLSGFARLQPSEPYLQLTFTGNGRGQIKVEGRAQTRFEVRTYLSSEFLIDQTFLPKIANGLSGHLNPSAGS